MRFMNALSDSGGKDGSAAGAAMVAGRPSAACVPGVDPSGLDGCDGSGSALAIAAMATGLEASAIATRSGGRTTGGVG